MEDRSKKLYFECACHSDEHTLKFSFFDYIKDPHDPQIYAHVFLGQYHNVFQRMWISIKYVLGYKSQFGHFDEFVFKETDAPKMKKMMEDYQEAVERRNVEIKKSFSSKQEKK